MKNAKKKSTKLESLKRFKSNIDRTDRFIHGLMSNVEATEQLMESLKVDKKKKENKKFIKLLEFDKKSKEYIFEVGFIVLYSNFEYFMYDLLLEYYERFPKSFIDERQVSLQEVCKLRTIDEVKQYFGDKIAIDKSRDIKTWTDYLLSQYGIKFYDTEKEKEFFILSSALRNSFMHAGAKTNTNFRKDLEKIILAEIPLYQKINLDRKKLYHGLYGFFKQKILSLNKHGY